MPGWKGEIFVNSLDKSAVASPLDVTDSIERTKEFLVTDRKFEEINPLLAGYEKCAPGHFFGPWIRNCYIIHYVQSGKGCFLREGEEYTLSKGDLFLIRPSELCKYYADSQDPWTYVWIGFSGSRAVQFLETTCFYGNRCAVHAPQAEYIFSEIQNVKARSISLEFFLCSKIYELFSVLCTARPENEYVEKAVNYIGSNYSSPLSVEEIARLLNIDRRHLGRLFTAQTGMSPKEYLIRVRLQNAAELLRSSDYPVSEIAQLVGYDDCGSFLKIFKKKYGMTPSQFRRG